MEYSVRPWVQGCHFSCLIARVQADVFTAQVWGWGTEIKPLGIRMTLYIKYDDAIYTVGSVKHKYEI